ncbi:hypothetical protein [Allobranchiibius sp. GilTou73]|uniref:hypothetical protein n=1 Tax=Allobranchiibius sp. GilTou73 TaxID=2904523 RepID=UPI001F18DE0E|nr:hypothetical protein [Allobranchiibius sp. GilTou73]UIJ34751.1 hypothetical protein LVQ62_16910 [Allobranchiibius sp. GilTou73]
MPAAATADMPTQSLPRNGRMRRSRHLETATARTTSTIGAAMGRVRPMVSARTAATTHCSRSSASRKPISTSRASDSV